MKKTLLLVLVLCFCTFSVFASKSWFGVEGFTAYSEETTTFTVLGIDFPEDSKATLMGITVSGTLFPSENSPFGLGYQIGAGKLVNATHGSSQDDVSDYPLTWKGSLSCQYSADFTKQLSMQLGVGALYESMTKGADNNNSEAVVIKYNTFSIIANADLLFHVSDSLAILGGVSVAIPLSSQATVTSGDFSIDSGIAVKGYTVLGQLGVAFFL